MGSTPHGITNFYHGVLSSTACGNIFPTGSVSAFATPSCPVGWIKTDGSAISRASNKCLFDTIGVTHGSGNGSTTFNIPNYRGRFLRGTAEGSANDPDRGSRSAMAAGGNVGDRVGSTQSDLIASHSHYYVNYPGYAGADANNPSRGDFGGNANGTSFSSTGGNETRPENAYVLFCIKL